jgi:hypothetical protein
MRSIKEKYKGVNEGTFSKSQFLIDAQKELPRSITKLNSFNDVVSILTSKGILGESASPKAPITYGFKSTTSKIDESKVNKALEEVVKNTIIDIFHNN